MADYFVVEELKAYLIAQGVGVAPTAKDAPRVTVPTIWLQPRDGAAQPRFSDQYAGYQEDITVTLVEQQTAAPAGGMEDWLEETFVDVIVRSRQMAAGKLVHRAIRGLIHPVSTPWGRQMWTMNSLLVEYSTMWRAEQAIASTPVDYTRTASYRFGCRRKALAGLPYVP